MGRLRPGHTVNTPGLQLPPLSLYVHVPWCVRKCPYCDFNSHEASGALPEDDYIRALIEDLDQDLAMVQGRSLQSIFIGGGTPSLFSGRSYGRLLTAIAQRTSLAPDVEITLEANPGTTEYQRFSDYRTAGINRLSIGAQSFDDAQLRTLGRIHDSTEIRRAAREAHRAGFDNFNIDLMYALPDQTPEAACEDLRQALQLEPAHLSWYQLTIEPNTSFYKRPPDALPEETVIDTQDRGLSLLESAGLQRYEVSAWARPGRASVHNLNYWTFGDYLGIGAGAHGKITLPGESRIVRTRKRRQPDHYLKSSLTRSAGCDPVPDNQLVLEFLMNALRLTGGFTVPQFEAHTGLPFGTLEKQVESLTDRGLMTCEGERCRTTPRGLQLLDSVLETFL
ncbi:MAG: radical SAM family heme chaperone HemW [Pseudohongiellaceae bacterium]